MERMLGQLLYITHNKEYIEYVVVYSLLLCSPER